MIVVVMMMMMMMTMMIKYIYNRGIEWSSNKQTGQQSKQPPLLSKTFHFTDNVNQYHDNPDPDQSELNPPQPCLFACNFHECAILARSQAFWRQKLDLFHPIFPLVVRESSKSDRQILKHKYHTTISFHIIKSFQTLYTKFLSS